MTGCNHCGLEQPIPAIILKPEGPVEKFSGRNLPPKRKQITEEEKELTPEKPKKVSRVRLERVSAKKMRSAKGKGRNPLDDVDSVEPAPTNDEANEQLTQEWFENPVFVSMVKELSELDGDYEMTYFIVP